MNIKIGHLSICKLTNDIRTIPSPTPAGTAITVTPKRDSWTPRNRPKSAKIFIVRCQRGANLTIVMRVNHTERTEAKKSLNCSVL